MQKYRKKPVVIEAEYWGGWELFKDHKYHPVIKPLPFWKAFLLGMTLKGHPPCERGWVKTLEGGHVIDPGDYLIKGVKGEYYPCKPDIFKMTYEPAD